MYQTPYASARPSADVTEQIRSSSIASNFSPLLAAALSVDASPEASDEHINKKQRSNSFQPSNDDVKQHSRVNGTNDVTMSDANVVNGNDTTIGTHGSVQENGVSHKGMKSTSPVENGAAPKSTSRAHRSRSNSTSSSLSSVDEKVLEDPTIISPHRPHPANTSHARPIAVPFQTMSSVSSLPRSFSMAQFYSAPTPQQRASPYTSSDTFKVAAREASNAARPVAPPKNGPKTFTFKTAPKLPSPAPPQRSSPATLQSTAATSAAPAKSSAEEMAPSSPVQPSKATTAPSKKLPLTFKQKNAKKVVGVALDDSDNSNQMKRKAKEITTGKKDPDESFERHHVGGEENGWASDGGDSIAVKATKKPKKTPKVRLLNRSRETRQNSRYASEEGSSPTELGFKAPFPVSDSVPSSRAGTPIAANRLSRKPKTGSGLRVKTS